MKIINKNQTIQQVKFNFEKDIQQIVENNLQTLFGYELIKHEFTIHNLAINNHRIDTLAYDRENNSFIIIEYKKSKSKSVVDQGHAYLAALSKNKASFVLSYIETKNEMKLESDFDWSQTLIMFIAPEYMAYSREATSFKDLPFQLWKVYKFEGDIIVLNQIIVEKAPDSIQYFIRNKQLSENKPNEGEIETRLYDLNYHLEKGSDVVKEIYEKYQEAIQDLDNRIEIKFNKKYIAFKISNWNFCNIKIKKNELLCELYISVDEFSKLDPDHIVKKHPDETRKNLCILTINPELRFHYAMELIEASYTRIVNK